MQTYRKLLEKGEIISIEERFARDELARYLAGLLKI